MQARFRAFVTVLALALLATSAQAIPVLQIYVEGAIYDSNTETWVTSQSDFKLWVVGDVDAFGTIHGATLTASFFGLGGTITFTPSTTGLITDPSVSPGLVLAGTGNGEHPILPPHGIFNDATLHHWEDWAMGDMTLTDSPIGDYNGSPAWPNSFPDNGQLNVYDVHVEGWTKVHFDAYGTTIDTLDGKETTWKTPNSHDGQVPVQDETWEGMKALYRN
jgi:hypothetical protein